jgi:hypothetical protein
LPKNKKGLIAEREEGTAQRGKDLELVIGPLDRRDGITERDDLFAIMERTPADKDMGYAPCLQSTDVGPCDIAAEATEATEENGNVPWPDRDGAALLFDRPAALVDQPVDEGADGAGQRFVDAPVGDLAEITVRFRKG